METYKFKRNENDDYSIDYVDDFVGGVIKDYDPHMRYEVILRKHKSYGYAYVLKDKKSKYLYDSYAQTGGTFKKIIDASFEAGRHIAYREWEHAKERNAFLVKRAEENRGK